MATPLSADSLVRLYDGLEKIDPKDLKKLGNAEGAERLKTLNAIAKKILVTENKDSKVKVKAKPFAWGFIHFFRRICGISTKEKTNLHSALSQIRLSFPEAQKNCTQDQQAKLDTLKEIINAVIKKTGSGDQIDSQQRTITPTQNRTAVVDEIGGQALATNAPPQPPPPPPVQAASAAKKTALQDHEAAKKKALELYAKQPQDTEISTGNNSLKQCLQLLEAGITNDNAQEITHVQRALVEHVTNYEHKLTSAHTEYSKSAFQAQIGKKLTNVERTQGKATTEVRALPLLTRALDIPFSDLRTRALNTLKLTLPQSLEEAKQFNKAFKQIQKEKEAELERLFEEVGQRKNEATNNAKRLLQAYERAVHDKIAPKLKDIEKFKDDVLQKYDRDIRGHEHEHTRLQAANGKNPPTAAMKDVQQKLEQSKNEKVLFSKFSESLINHIKGKIDSAKPTNPATQKADLDDTLEHIRSSVATLAPLFEGKTDIEMRIHKFVQFATDELLDAQREKLESKFAKELKTFPHLLKELEAASVRSEPIEDKPVTQTKQSAVKQKQAAFKASTTPAKPKSALELEEQRYQQDRHRLIEVENSILRAKDAARAALEATHEVKPAQSEPKDRLNDIRKNIEKLDIDWDWEAYQDYETLVSQLTTYCASEKPTNKKQLEAATKALMEKCTADEPFKTLKSHLESLQAELAKL